MTKVIVSFASGEEYIQMLGIALPSFYKYAYMHGYDVIIPSFNNIDSICQSYGWDSCRPISWLKIPIIKHFLSTGYDLVQWLDSDVVINKFDKDICENFYSSSCNQSFVVHHDLYEGFVPNCGIWSLKKSAIPLLDDIWSKTDFVNHKWWEQGANIDIINNNKAVAQSCFILPYEFNVHKNDTRFREKNWEKEGRMIHATCWPNKIQKMKEWSNGL